MASVLSRARRRLRGMERRATRARRSAAWIFAAALLLGCGRVPAQPPRLSPAAIAWAVGPGQRGEEPPPGYRYLLALPSKPPAGEGPGLPTPVPGKPRPVLPGCFEAMAFLPAPAGDPRFFFLRDGIVHVSRSPRELPARLDGNDPALGVTRLLAFARHTSPLELLVAARAGGAQQEQLWLLRIGSDAILSAKLVTEEQGFTSQEDFFARFNAPRCLTGGRSCLVPSWDGASSFLDVEPVRGQPPVAFQELGRLQVVDAAWAPDGEAYYVLVPCPGPTD